MVGIAEAKPAEMAVVRAASMAGIAEVKPAEMAADWHGVEVIPADELRGVLLLFPLLRISLEWFW